MVQSNKGFSIIKILLPMAFVALFTLAYLITYQNYKSLDNVDLSLTRLNKNNQVKSIFIQRAEDAANYLSPNDIDKTNAYHGYVEFFPENAQLIGTASKFINGSDTLTLRYQGALNKQLFQCSHEPSLPNTPVESFFYITSEAQLACCMVVNGQPNFSQQEILIEGVEALRVRYGEDTDNDGVANHFTANKPSLSMNNVQNLKISLLIKSFDKDKNPMNAKYYTLQDIELGPYTDDMHRRVFTVSLPLKR